MTIDEVPVWMTFRGIGHAVQSRNGGPLDTCTACQSVGNFPGAIFGREKPKRICRVCRERIKDARLVGVASR